MRPGGAAGCTAHQFVRRSWERFSTPCLGCAQVTWWCRVPAAWVGAKAVSEPVDHVGVERERASAESAGASVGAEGIPAEKRPIKPKPSILSALGWFAASYGLAIIGYLVANALVSRWLGTAGFGYFMIATTVAAGIGQFALLGAHRAGLRDASILDGETDVAKVAELRSGARAAAWLSLPTAAIVGGSVFFAVVEGETLVARAAAALAFAALIYLNGLQKLWANLLRGFGAVRLAALLEGRSGGSLVAVSQAAFLTVGLLLAEELGLLGALTATAVAFALPVLALGQVVRKKWRDEPARSVFNAWRHGTTRNWRFALNQVASYMSGAVEIWMAGILLSAADTSTFSSAQRLAMLIAIPLASMQVVFAPTCARLLARGERQKLQTVLQAGATLSLLLALVLWLPMLIFPNDVMALVYGDPFAAAGVVLFVISIGSAANVFTGLSGIALTMSHREGVAAAIQGVALAARIVIGTGAALAYGVMGLAVASAAITAISYAVSWWLARSLLGVSTCATLRPSMRSLLTTGV